MSRYILLLSALVWVGCTQTPPSAPALNRGGNVPQVITPDLSVSPDAMHARSTPGEQTLLRMNRTLRRAGLPFSIGRIDFLVKPGFEAQGRTLYASDRERLLGSRWVPDDLRREADGNTLTYMIVKSGCGFPGIPSEQVESAFEGAQSAWQSTARCGDLILQERPDRGEDPTIADYLLGLGGRGTPYQADIVDAGFESGDMFEQLAPNGRLFILGVTFTFIFMDEDGRATDLDGNGMFDTAVTETYLNQEFAWTAGGSFGYDIETVALHENGHALGLGHFGEIFRTRNGDVHAAPRAVMNAAYLGPLTTPQRTDRSSFCNLYATWP